MALDSAARRLSVLAIVAAAHALALAFLVELTRTHRLASVAEEVMTLLVLEPAVRPRPLAPPLAVARPHARPAHALAPPEAASPPSQPPPPEGGSAAIDWAAEGAEAAARVARGEDASRGARTFGVPPPSPIFAPGTARRPGLAWNHARTHRVEVLPEGITLFNINDNCAIALLWVVPAFACQLGKIPPRGDLFEHMRDLREQEGR